jgi:hypothetical protein
VSHARGSQRHALSAEPASAGLATTGPDPLTIRSGAHEHNESSDRHGRAQVGFDTAKWSPPPQGVTNSVFRAALIHLADMMDG